MLAIFIPVAAAALIYIQQPEQKLLDNYQLNRINAFLYPEEYDDERYLKIFLSKARKARIVRQGHFLLYIHMPHGNTSTPTARQKAQAC